MTEKKENDHVFAHEWAAVVRAFYDKYPNKELDMVQYNKLIGLDYTAEGLLKLKRVQYIQKWRYFWAYIQEEITINPATKTMEMQSKVLKKGDMVPIFGTEYITYKAIREPSDSLERTLYSKRLVLDGAIHKAMGAFGDGFQKGIKIVEDNVDRFKSMSADDWVASFSLLQK